MPAAGYQGSYNSTNKPILRQVVSLILSSLILGQGISAKTEEF
jgi:hypothetical protein